MCIYTTDKRLYTAVAYISYARSYARAGRSEALAGPVIDQPRWPDKDRRILTDHKF